ncbi:hypothetical protein KAH94_06355 [bacterium]|nr:hypothetical protein [bacterium]
MNKLFFSILFLITAQLHCMDQKNKIPNNYINKIPTNYIIAVAKERLKDHNLSDLQKLVFKGIIKTNGRNIYNIDPVAFLFAPYLKFYNMEKVPTYYKDLLQRYKQFCFPKEMFAIINKSLSDAEIKILNPLLLGKLSRVLIPGETIFTDEYKTPKVNGCSLENPHYTCFMQAYHITAPLQRNFKKYEQKEKQTVLKSFEELEKTINSNKKRIKELNTLLFLGKKLSSSYSEISNAIVNSEDNINSEIDNNDYKIEIKKEYTQETIFELNKQAKIENARTSFFNSLHKSIENQQGHMLIIKFK